MGVETSEQRVKAAVPSAVLKKMPREKTHWSVWAVVANRGTWLTSGHRYSDPDGAWDKSLQHPSVRAFESTLRVQDASPFEGAAATGGHHDLPDGWIPPKDAPEVVREAEGKTKETNSLLDPEVCPDCDGVGEIDTMDRKTLPCPTCIYRELEAKKSATKPLSPDSPGRNGFICAEWRVVEEGPILNYEKPYKRRRLVNRCDLPEGHQGKHLDHVLLVSWDAEYPPHSLRTRPEGEAKVEWRVEPQTKIEHDGTFSGKSSILTTTHDTEESAASQVESWRKNRKSVCRVFMVETTVRETQVELAKEPSRG